MNGEDHSAARSAYPALDPVELLAAQGSLNWRTRAFLRIRWNVTPFLDMANDVPRGGKILDLGCGHGMFALLMAMRDSSCEVYGVDHEIVRIEVANSTRDRLPNARFVVGSLADVEKASFPLNADWRSLPPFRTITIIDVMHYFRVAHQEAILKHCAQWLEPGGTLLIRDVDPDNGFASWINRAYEKAATALGITRSDEKSDLFFRSVEEWTSVLEGLGFDVCSRPCTYSACSDVLFVARKSNSASA